MHIIVLSTSAKKYISRSLILACPGKKMQKRKWGRGSIFATTPSPLDLIHFPCFPCSWGNLGSQEAPVVWYILRGCLLMFPRNRGESQANSTTPFSTLRGVQMSDEDPWCLSLSMNCFISGFLHQLFRHYGTLLALDHRASEWLGWVPVPSDTFRFHMAKEWIDVLGCSPSTPYFLRLS